MPQDLGWGTAESLYVDIQGQVILRLPVKQWLQGSMAYKFTNKTKNGHEP
jgi:hypothetical protein